MFNTLLNRDLSTTNTKSLPKTIEIGHGAKLTLDHAYALAKYNPSIQLTATSYPGLKQSYDFLHSFIDKRLAVYGINTHFGDQVNLLDSQINNLEQPDAYYQSIQERQQNLIRSHACGLGEIVASDTVKVAMMLRVHCLAQGFSGVSTKSIETIINFLNHGIIPRVRRYGSIGASGDLIPLAMIAAAICGENVPVVYHGREMALPDALAQAGLEKCTLTGRDGLAMINGTSFMTAQASLAIFDLRRLFTQMLHTIAICLEAMQVIQSAYCPLVHQLKKQRGQIFINDFMLHHWQHSHLLNNLEEIRENSNRTVQDYYSLRAIPQGFGTFYENLLNAIEWIENEMNSVNDNPIIDVDEGKIHHNANFMGYYVSDTCDILKMNIAQASNWLHALLANLVHPRKNQGLPTNLVLDPSKENGFRPLQLLAASLAVQNRKLAQIQQAFMLPTEGDNQDVNSLGTHAAFDLREAVDNLERLTAILLLAGIQAIEFRGVEKASKTTQKIYTFVRNHTKTITDSDLVLGEIETAINILKNSNLGLS